MLFHKKNNYFNALELTQLSNFDAFLKITGLSCNGSSFLLSNFFFSDMFPIELLLLCVNGICRKYGKIWNVDRLEFLKKLKNYFSRRKKKAMDIFSNNHSTSTEKFLAKINLKQEVILFGTAKMYYSRVLNSLKTGLMK